MDKEPILSPLMNMKHLCKLLELSIDLHLSLCDYHVSSIVFTALGLLIVYIANLMVYRTQTLQLSHHILRFFSIHIQFRLARMEGH